MAMFAGSMTWRSRRHRRAELGLDIGMRSDGRRLVLPFPEMPHILIAGLTGSGKSGILNSMLFALAGLPNVAIIGIDLKGGVELSPWVDRLTMLAADGSQVDDVFFALRAEVEWRQDFLTAAGERSWRPEFGPWLVVIFDEFAELGVADLSRLIEATQLSKDTAGDKALSQMMQAARHSLALRSGILESFARKCRALGVMIVAATQYPTADVVDTQVRAQFEIRMMCRVASKEQLKVCLGAGMEEQVDVRDISPDQRGSFVLAGLTAKTLIARASLVDDATVRATAAATARLRVAPEALFDRQGTSDVPVAGEAPYQGGAAVMEPVGASPDGVVWL